MNCDIIGLQEISFLNYNQLNDLNKANLISDLNPSKISKENLSEKPESSVYIDNMRQYKQYCCESQINIKRIFPNNDKEFSIDGNATLSSLSLEKGQNEAFYLEDHKILHLSAERVAQMLIYKIHNSGKKFVFVNCHLHHVIEDESIRLYQSKILCKWISTETEKEDIIVVVGDFNALPFGLAYNCFLENDFVSVHEKFHGCEPEKTFHNKMEAPFKDTDPEGTFDYIFVKTPKDIQLIVVSDEYLQTNMGKGDQIAGSYLKVHSVEVHGQEECRINKGIYASDHYGLCCDIELSLL